MRITGFYSLEFDVSNFGDLVAAVDAARAAGCGDDFEVDLSWSPTQQQNVLYVTSPDGLEGELVECGSHIPPERRFDVTFPIHSCEGE